jgi:phage FluMu protein Com
MGLSTYDKEASMARLGQLLHRKAGSSTDGGVDFVKKETSGPNTYETYRAPDAETAKAFLETREVTEDQYYVVAETPEGNWGVDKLGLYLEHLLPWQTDVAAAECEGEIHGLANPTSLTMAAKGINDSFVVTVECGRCGHTWKDAVRYQNLTAVRCPGCKALNKVDSERFMVVG